MKIAFALLSAMLSLLAAIPTSAQPGPFVVGALLPDVTARDTNGKTVELRSLRGKKRVVLLSTQDKAYQDNVRQHQAQFAERDVVVLTTPLLSFQFCLVGKDGHIKMAQHAIPTNEELFATIDAMPMRRAEMRRRK